MSIKTANISYNEHGTPVADAFDDVYFSNQDGMAETRYVFIDNNFLTQRWASSSQERFTIAETGFGTGLNFLTTVKQFIDFRRSNPEKPLHSLYFISFEKFPVSASDLNISLQHWAGLAGIAAHLIEQYPSPIPGCHRLLFDLGTAISGNITLDLWFGDVNEVLPTLPQHLHRRVDAWFLDGFAPAKNPDMWQQNLFDYMAKLTASEGTLATFTAAGLVKRGLRDAGFTIEKCKGFGKKRDMLRGRLAASDATSCDVSSTRITDRQTAIYWQRNAAQDVAHPNQHHVVVIGAGLAGLNTAYALLRHGFRVTVIERGNTLASGASGNSQGGFYPQLTVDFTLPSQLYSQSFYYAQQRYRDLLRQGHHFGHDFCGVLQLSFNEQQRIRQQKLADKHLWPTQLIHPVDQVTAQNIAGVELPCGGLFIPDGGWINPAQLVNALAEACQQYSDFQLLLKCPVDSLTQQIEAENNHSNWRLELGASSVKSPLMANSVVLANSVACQQFSQCDGLTIQAVRGQVEYLPQANELGQLQTVLCHKGYITPAQNGQHNVGATFDKNQTDVDYRVTDEQRNIDTVHKALPTLSWLNSINTQQTGRASIRGSTADHLPLVGNVPNIHAQAEQYAELHKASQYTELSAPIQWQNLFMIAGLGSRGLCTAPLLAEVLACQLSGKPLPLTQQQLNALSPNRFLLRQLIRRS